MGRVGLSDPLGAARMITMLHDELVRLGFAISASTDLRAFDALKLKLRGERAHPYHDPNICNLPPERQFWMAIDRPDATIGLQAFRFDRIDTSLADWAPAYTIGLYMRRQELLIPLHAAPPAGSIAERLTGRLVYHGELWIDPAVKSRRVCDLFGRLGMLMALIKWHPDAIWALAGQAMATRGHLNRMGYAHLERGFFRWQFVSEGIDQVEWIAIAERTALEQLIAEMLTTPQGLL